MLGWRSWHVADSRKVTKRGVVGDKGIKDFPDLVLVKVRLSELELDLVREGNLGAVIFRELKVKAPVTAGQAEALEQLRAAGADADVWRPADLESGRIEAELRGVPWTK
jgi:hypothetical protein